MTTPEAKWALFSAQDPPAGQRAPQEGWKLLGNDLHSKAANNAGIQVLGAGAALLPLPDGLPTLCRCVATAQEYGLKYTVWLFDQPLLSCSPGVPLEEQ